MCVEGGVRFGREPNCVRGKGTSVRARTEQCARKEVFGSGQNRTVCAERGLRFGREPNCLRGRRTLVRARTELCARKEDLVSARTDLYARKTVIPWTIIYVCEWGMIRVYRLKCESLEMFSVCE